MRRRWLIIFLMTMNLAWGAVVAQETLVTDETRTLNFTPAQFFFSFSFIGKPQEAYSLTVQSPDEVPTIVRVFAPDGSVLIDSPGQIQTSLVLSDLPEEGVTLTLNRPDSSTASGAVLVSIRPLNIRSLPDEAVSGNLTSDDPINAYAFQAEQGAFLAVTTQGSMLGWQLLAPDGQLLFEDGFYDNPRLPLFILPERGTYRLILQTLAEETRYNLRARLVEAIPLDAAEAVTGTTRADALPYFTFTSEAGKLWQITASLPEGNKRMILLNGDPQLEPWQRELAIDFDSGPQGNPRISAFLTPTTGTYIVILDYATFDGDGANNIDYGITLAPDARETLTPGASVNGVISPETGVITYLFEGKLGEIYQITLSRTSNVGSPSVRVVGPADVVASFDGRNGLSANFRFQLPADGLYQVVISNIDYTPSTLEYALQFDRG